MIHVGVDEVLRSAGGQVAPVDRITPKELFMAHPLLRRNRWTRLSKRLRTEWRAQGVSCHLCGLPIRPDQEMDVDHLEPVNVAPHRAHNLMNLAPAHASCNRSKGDRTDDVDARPARTRPVCELADEPILTTTVRWFGPSGSCLRFGTRACLRTCPAHPTMVQVDDDSYKPN